MTFHNGQDRIRPNGSRQDRVSVVVRHELSGPEMAEVLVCAADPDDGQLTRHEAEVVLRGELERSGERAGASWWYLVPPRQRAGRIEWAADQVHRLWPEIDAADLIEWRNFWQRQARLEVGEGAGKTVMSAAPLDQVGAERLFDRLVSRMARDRDVLTVSALVHNFPYRSRPWVARRMTALAAGDAPLPGIRLEVATTPGQYVVHRTRTPAPNGTARRFDLARLRRELKRWPAEPPRGRLRRVLDRLFPGWDEG